MLKSIQTHHLLYARRATTLSSCKGTLVHCRTSIQGVPDINQSQSGLTEPHSRGLMLQEKFEGEAGYLKNVPGGYTLLWELTVSYSLDPERVEHTDVP